MNLAEVYSLIGQLKRSFPRHTSILALCSLTEELMAGRGVGEVKKPDVDQSHRDYMRNYMREWRKRRRAASVEPEHQADADQAQNDTHGR